MAKRNLDQNSQLSWSCVIWSIQVSNKALNEIIWITQYRKMQEKYIQEIVLNRQNIYIKVVQNISNSVEYIKYIQKIVQNAPGAKVDSRDLKDLDCFCFRRDVTSFISRSRLSFQQNVLYGCFCWINTRVRLQRTLRKRFGNQTLH